MANESWEKEGDLTPVWEYAKAGDTIIGVVKEIKKGKFDPMNYVIVDNNNLEWLVWGTAILSSRMSKIKQGDLVKIVYLGKTKTKTGMEAHNFEVFKAKTK